MSEMILERPSDTGCTPHRPIRVTLREIRETAWRALLASGLSAGEAATSADLITAMELHEGAGLAVLEEQLRTGPPGRQSIRTTRSAVIVLADPAERNAVLLAPLAIDMALATRQPVLVPSRTLAAAYEWYSVQVSTADQPDIVLSEISSDGVIVESSAVSDGTLRRGLGTNAPSAGGPALAHAASAAAAVGGGVLIYPVSSVPNDIGVAVSTSDARATRRRTALSMGINLDAPVWRRVLDASHLFLVSEADNV